MILYDYQKRKYLLLHKVKFVQYSTHSVIGTLRTEVRG